MSKRFGRNQKRRMRAAIFEAELKAIRFEEAHRMANALAKDQGERIRELESLLEDVSDVLQQHSAALPAESIEASDKRMRFIQLADDDFSRSIHPWHDAPSRTEFKISRLRVMTTEVRNDPFRCGKHVHVRFGDEPFGYAIDDAAIRSMPKTMLVRRISESLAMMISKQLKEAA